MTTLNRLSMGYLPAVSFDEAYGDRELRTAVDVLVKRGDWHPFRDLLLASGDGWALKDHRVGYVAARAAGRPVLQEWVEAEPDSADALTVLSRAETVRAWAVRSGRRARFVRKSAWPKFFEILGRADDIAAQACERAPMDPTPAVTAVTIARGLQVSRREFNARWAAVVARDPLHPRGHHHALQYLCAKWSGSHKQMFQFARDAAEKAPPGHPLAVLPLYANLEMRLDDDGVGLGSARFGMDLARVRERWIEVNPDPYPRIVEDRALLAFYLGLVQRPAEAAVHFRAMGALGSTVGWEYFTLAPRHAFRRDRAAALRSESTGRAVRKS
ncbi:hypothetical protein OIE69_06535 [Actinacidiphila glaucinigra]|uniref:hypothetical protein n=1 Tax=Actinacidiphila glaucinigra TaxID=235986 RepID=UPI002DD8D210|nr:hypothetical protein [Actinacidiphila glaucinigra]WSD58588.1 hypothetical protein OIE69_06535 [Actinacidiphila glaucinigra]